MLHSCHHQVANVVARDAARCGQEAHSLPTTAVEPAIAEQKSFAKAATLLGIGRSTLSRNVRSLEERLGGGGAPPVLDQLTATADEAIDQRSEPSGLLRLVVLQPPVATLMIEPILARFMLAYPGIQLDVAVIKMPGDIVHDGFDAGIRVRWSVT